MDTDVGTAGFLGVPLADDGRPFTLLFGEFLLLRLLCINETGELLVFVDLFRLDIIR